jgi:hypothetical protein
MDIMKKLLLVLLSTISFSAFAAQSAITGSNLVATGKTHVISDASSGGGGEDRRREVLSVQVVDGKGLATSAKCTLTNDKGDWSTTAPGTVTVLRSEGELTIVCSKDGNDARTLIVSAGTTQIQPKHFRFQADSDDSDDPITVPYYNATITLSLIPPGAPQSSN